MSSPNARTLEWFRKRGVLCEIVERHSPFPKPWGKKHDLFGVFDLLAFTRGCTIGVQATSNSNVASRVAKIRESEVLRRWLGLGNKVYVTGWAKLGKQGRRKLWTMKLLEVNEYGEILHPGAEILADEPSDQGGAEPAAEADGESSTKR